MKPMIVGSRGSPLALAQTRLVVGDLKRAWAGRNFEIHVIKTEGDRLADLPPTGDQELSKGLFTGEIERALAAGEIDVAVHSAKDLPSEMTPGLGLGGVLPRASVEDVLIRKTAGAAGQAIATGSVRRAYQLRWKFRSVEIVDLRGNVPTRLRKFVESDWQGIVLARAGLERLGFDLDLGAFEFEGASLRAEILSTDDFLPAGGQGIIVLQVRSDDGHGNEVVQGVSHAETLSCLEAEREFLRLLQGDCGSPVGVLAALAGSRMKLRAQVFEPPRIEPRFARVEGEASAPRKLARELWEAING